MYLLKFWGVAVSHTILLNFIQYFFCKFVIDGINKLCVVINNTDSPLVLWFTFTWTISDIPGGGGGLGLMFAGDVRAGLSEPLPHYSLFLGKL